MLPILIINFEKHQIVKNDLLEMLTSSPNHHVSGDEKIDDCISKTDFYVSSKDLYFDFLMKFMMPDLKNTYEQMLGYKEWIIGDHWFQEYRQNDRHEWHRHAGCAWNNVYYLELPKDSPGTELMVPISNEVISPEVCEGDILIFPSVFKHRSPQNRSTDKKTVVAFNVL